MPRWARVGAVTSGRIATLIPPRRGQTTRFHGILASAHRLRAGVVPAAPVTNPTDAIPPTAMTVARRLDWASLLRRVWGPDVTACPSCGDTLRVLAFITQPDVTARILEHLGLATVVPPRSPARAPPDDDLGELEFAFS